MFRKIYENGYSVLPINPNGKNPIIQEWQKYCREMPSDQLVDKWDTQKLNIGVACGPASNLIVIDIDTDDADILNLLPPSPVRRRGKKGEARFFRVPSKVSSLRDIESRSFPFLADILADGRQCLIPHSIHPETKKPYFWLTPDTLENMKAEDLPEFDPSVIPVLERLSQKLFKSTDASASGRNNKLKSIVTAMRARGEDELKIVDEIYAWDKIHHSPRLFTDAKESYKAENEEDAKINAWKFVSKVTISLITSGVAKLTENQTIEISEDQIEIAKKECFKFIPYPKPRGAMLDFYELCELKSAGNQDAIGLGGAIALMSVLASNKFVTECRGLTTCPNNYIINLAYSSFGKELSQSIINDLLADSGLLGSGNYKSDVSFIMNLPNQQERLDVIDECSTLLKAMGSKEGYASNIVELMSELYTKGSTRYHGQTTLNHGQSFGACYNPQVSFLGSTTPKGFRTSVTKEVAAKGFLPRMLIFFQNEVGEYRGRKKRVSGEKQQKALEAFVSKMVKTEKIVHPDFNPEQNILAKIKNEKGEDVSLGIRYQPRIVKMTDEAHEYWIDLEEKYHNQKRIDPDGFESAFIGRFAEITAKLALLDALSLGRSRIDVDSVIWGNEVVTTCWHNSKPLYELAHAENWVESNVIRVLSFIKASPNGTVDRTKLISQNRWIKSRELDEVINSLEESGKIVKVNANQGKSTKPKIVYMASK